MTIEQISTPLVALVAGLVALGWLLKRAWRAVRGSVQAVDTIQRTYEVVRALKTQGDQHEARLDAFDEAAARTAAAAAADVAAAKVSRANLDASAAATRTALESLERRLTAVAHSSGRRATDVAVVAVVPTARPDTDLTREEDDP